MDLFCVGYDYIIKEAIEKIENAKNRAVIVVNKDKKVVGVLTQGDIIRALISGMNLYSRIESIVRPNFFYIKEMNMKKAYDIFKKHEITILPVVDDAFMLQDVITMKDIYRYMDNE